MKAQTKETLVPAYRCRDCGEIFEKDEAAIKWTSDNGMVNTIANGTPMCPACDCETLEEGQTVRKCK